MQKADKIARLKDSKAFKEKLISYVEEVTAKPLGMKQGSSATHIVVMKIQGDQPNYHRTLTEAHPTLSMGDLFRPYLFIGVQMDTRSWKIPAQAYHLHQRPAYRLEVGAKVVYKATNAQLVVEHETGMAELEDLITERIRTFINGINIIKSVNHFHDDLRDFLLRSLSRDDHGLGIYVEDITPQVELSQTLLDSFVKASPTPKKHTIPAAQYYLSDRSAEPLQVEVTLVYKMTVDQYKAVYEEALQQLDVLVKDTITRHLNQVEGEVDFAKLHALLAQQIKHDLQFSDSVLECGLEVSSISVKANFSRERLDDYGEIRKAKSQLDKEHLTEVHGRQQANERERLDIDLEAKTREAIKQKLRTEIMYGMPMEEVIMRVDPALMIDFYNKDWNEGLRNLQARMRERIDEERQRLRGENTRLLSDLNERVKLLKEMGADPRDIKPLLEEAVERAKGGGSEGMLSDVEIRNQILSESFPASAKPQPKQITGSDDDLE